MISRRQFKRDCLTFIDKSNELSDEWEVVTGLQSQNKDDDIYIVKKTTSLVVGSHGKIPAHPVQTEIEPSSSIEQGLGESDDEVMHMAEVIGVDNEACSIDGSNPKPVVFEYHIVYSIAYSVPVLYFNAHSMSGKLLKLEDIWGLVPEHLKPSQSSEWWSFITQSEHPVLHRPFFQIHPCHTADIMANVTCTTHNYLVTWLSLLGPVLGLSISHLYADLCQPPRPTTTTTE